MKFLKHLFTVILGLYIIGAASASLASWLGCWGWECESAIRCPDGYAIHVTGKGYLPCESLDEFLKTENEELLR